MTEFTYLSREGFEKLKEDLKQLKTVERPYISRQIAEARDKGDLSENAEYDAAKDAQGLLEMKIAKLEDLVLNARIIDDENIKDTSKVLILSTVEIINLDSKKTHTYKLVSETEADPKNGKISVKSPIGASLIGKKVNDTVEVTVPAGLIRLKINSISR